MTETPSHKATRRPVLIIAAGRQRAGKTAFLNVLAQYARARGSELEIWNADQQNVTNNLATFHDDALQPASAETGDVKRWIEAKLSDIGEKGYDAILDVGGGETAFSRVLREIEVSEMLENCGVRVVLASLMAPDPADVDYLVSFVASGQFKPEDVLIILNAGLVDSDTSVMHAFAPVTRHPVVRDTVAQGAPMVVFPVLGCMGAVTERGLTFEEALSGKKQEGGTSLILVDRQRVSTWWRKSIPEFIAKIPASMLPTMGNSPDSSRSQAAQ